MKTLKKIYNTIAEWFLYYFYYRPLINRVMKKKISSLSRKKRKALLKAIYRSVLLNKRLIKRDEESIIRIIDSNKENI